MEKKGRRKGRGREEEEEKGRRVFQEDILVQSNMATQSFGLSQLTTRQVPGATTSRFGEGNRSS